MGTHFKGTRAEVRALDAYIKLMRAAESVAAALMPLLTENDLTLGQLGVLEALLHLGPMCQKDLGRKLLKSASNITTVIENLELRGLIGRRRDEADRRYYKVSLTRAGTSLIARVFPSHVRGIVSVFQALSSAEQEELGRLGKKLGLAARGEARPAEGTGGGVSTL